MAASQSSPPFFALLGVCAASLLRHIHNSRLGLLQKICGSLCMTFVTCPGCVHHTTDHAQSTPPSLSFMRSCSLTSGPPTSGLSTPLATDGGRDWRNIRPASVFANTRPPKASATFGLLPVARFSLERASVGSVSDDDDDASSATAAGGFVADLERSLVPALAWGQHSDATGPASSSRRSNACTTPRTSRAKNTAGRCSDQATDEIAAGQLLLLPPFLLLSAAAVDPASHVVSGTTEASCGIAGFGQGQVVGFAFRGS